MKSFLWLPLGAVSLALAACPQFQTPCEGESCGDADAGQGGGTDGGDDGGGIAQPVLPRPSRSTAINLTSDDAVLLAVNPDHGSLSVFNAEARTKVSSVALGVGSMPVSVAVHPDDATAFVVLRKAQKLVKVSGIDKVNPQVVAEVAVGSEPTGVALSPTGKLAVVANFGESTVTLVDTQAMSVAATVEVGTNPRAVAVTNDLDPEDGDERAYVTLFYGELTAETTDDGRVGKVVEVDLGSMTKGRTIDLAPIADTGFGTSLADGGTSPAVGCAPNQLYGIAINAGKAYVSHVCASPKGPVFKLTNLFSAISVIDLATGAEDRGPTGTGALSKLIASQGTATSNLLGVPVELDFKPGTNVAYLVSQAGDAVQRIHYKGSDPRGPIVLGPDSNFAQIDLRGQTGIKVPIGIVTARTRALAFVNNWVDRSVTVIDLAVQAASDAPIASEPKPTAGTAEARVLNGKKFFFTGVGRWSDRAVNSCGSCHPDGNSDNLTWVFAAGPRQTTPLDGTFSKTDPSDQRVLNWTGIFDEIHDFELNTRGTAGGKGAIVTGASPNDVPFNLALGLSLDGGSVVTRNDFLSGSTKHVVTLASSVKDWDDIEAFVQTVAANRAPTRLDGQQVARGRALFQNANCHFCHGGSKWTVSRQPFAPSPEKNGSLPGANGQPSLPTGLRTQGLDGGTLPLPNPSINTDTRKVDIERLTLADGGTLNVGPERITCVLRNVGTFAASNLIERKADGSQAQGAKGFNPPSLLGMATSAPYFHHGEARTLAEVFQAKYATHHQAGNALFLANGGGTPQEQAEIADLVAFLESIDERTPPFSVPAGYDICGGY
ncbi:MAG: hypothetical protein ACOZIN_15345 [Myxococcota bacterium]